MDGKRRPELNLGLVLDRRLAIDWLLIRLRNLVEKEGGLRGIAYYL